MKKVIQWPVMVVLGVVYLVGYVSGLFAEVFREGMDDGDAAVDAIITFISDEK